VQAKPEQSSSQHNAEVAPVIEAEFDLMIKLVPQLKSFELSVLPLHLPVMSWSQHALWPFFVIEAELDLR
jgi:hypothetical protein